MCQMRAQCLPPAQNCLLLIVPFQGTSLSLLSGARYLRLVQAMRWGQHHGKAG
jgi:hypothetical protein